MKSCRLSSKIPYSFIFPLSSNNISLSSNNILLSRYLPVVNALCQDQQFSRTSSTQRDKSKRRLRCFYFEPKSFLVMAARTSRLNRLIIDTLRPYCIHHLDQFTGYLDIAAIAVFIATVGHPIKHRTLPAKMLKKFDLSTQSQQSFRG
jgi:hypothetical protein